MPALTLRVSLSISHPPRTTEREGVLKTEQPVSWPYLGSSGPPLAEPVGRTLRSGVFHVAARRRPARPGRGRSASRIGPRGAKPQIPKK